MLENPMPNGILEGTIIVIAIISLCAIILIKKTKG